VEKVIYKNAVKKPIAKYRSISLSLIGHGLLLAAIFTIRPKLESPEKQLVNVIQARLYQPTIISKKTSTIKEVEVIPQNKSQIIPIKTNAIEEDHIEKIEIEIKREKELTSQPSTIDKEKPTTDINKLNITTELTKPVKAISKNVFSANQALNSLKEEISQQNYSQSAQQNYQDYIKAKNTIPRSITKFEQVADAKAKAVEVNCNNVFYKGMMMLSGLLKGSVKCTSYNGSQKFIDARLKKLGKKVTNKKERFLPSITPRLTTSSENKKDKPLQ